MSFPVEQPLRCDLLKVISWSGDFKESERGPTGPSDDGLLALRFAGRSAGFIFLLFFFLIFFSQVFGAELVGSLSPLPPAGPRWRASALRLIFFLFFFPQVFGAELVGSLSRTPPVGPVGVRLPYG